MSNEKYLAFRIKILEDDVKKKTKQIQKLNDQIMKQSMKVVMLQEQLKFSVVTSGKG